ncbi:protein L [Variovorax atrisoli]|uniref:protein L n=1 Tax=Variovorax atrisoli TaxID=3394203 RepID=UPI000F7E7AEF|nr:protein L [Variovorax sp. 369]RTD98573.1 protein L [Variovorax sp. 369]
MAWYVNGSVLQKGKPENSHWKTTYGPGDEVPLSGIYKCEGCKKEVTCNKPDKFPPQNHHQHSQAQGAIRWRLIVRTNTEGA